jgi:hypothetical protein
VRRRIKPLEKEKSHHLATEGVVEAVVEAARVDDRRPAPRAAAAPRAAVGAGGRKLYMVLDMPIDTLKKHYRP